MSSQKIDKCPLCDQPADFQVGTRFEEGIVESGYGGNCERCGHVRVIQSVVTKFKQSKKLHILSAFFRRYPNHQPPLVTAENVGELLGGTHMLRTVPEKMNALLELLVDTEEQPGTPLSFRSNRDYPLIFAANEGEASYLLDQLARYGHLASVGPGVRYQLTASGYERAEQLEAESYKSTRNAFVAMWFDKSRESIYKEAIEPAIREAGYQAIRIDLTEHVRKIDDEIVSNLRQSRFLVADFTGQRGGVYYEAGFMHGLGRNVFWMVEKRELENVHFDVRQYNFIDYESPAEAKRRLYYRIMAVEGKGPGGADGQ